MDVYSSGVVKDVCCHILKAIMAMISLLTVLVMMLPSERASDTRLENRSRSLYFWQKFPLSTSTSDFRGDNSLLQLCNHV